MQVHIGLVDVKAVCNASLVCDATRSDERTHHAFFLHVSESSVGQIAVDDVWVLKRI